MSGGYGAGARLLSVGIASTGLVTFAYFALASQALDDVAYARISLLWSVLVVCLSIVHRPIEQLLSRTIAAQRAVGGTSGHGLRTPLLVQAGFLAAFVLGALAVREPVTDGAFGGSSALFAILVAAVVAYAASYVARGWLAGHGRFGLYGALVFVEAVARCASAAAVTLGLASGADVVALGMAAAPLVSLVVVPWALRGRTGGEGSAEARGLAAGGRFALAVFGIMLAEQALLNAGVLLASADDAAVAGHVFTALLVARAPLQLFQAVQGSLLPHLAGAAARADTAAFDRAVRTTLLAVAAFGAATVAGLAVAGPDALDVLFDDEVRFGRWGLAVLGAGVALHLAAGTLTQAALATERGGAAAVRWLLAASGFTAFMALPVVADPLLRAEVGYAGAALALCAALWRVERRALSSSGGTRGPRARGGGPRPSASGRAS